MSFVGSLVCDRCKVVDQTEHAAGQALPPGWLVVGAHRHSCGDCATREEIAERAALAETLTRLPQKRRVAVTVLSEQAVDAVQRYGCPLVAAVRVPELRLELMAENARQVEALAAVRPTRPAVAAVESALAAVLRDRTRLPKAA